MSCTPKERKKRKKNRKIQKRKIEKLKKKTRGARTLNHKAADDIVGAEDFDEAFADHFDQVRVVHVTQLLLRTY